MGVGGDDERVPLVAHPLDRNVLAALRGPERDRLALGVDGDPVAGYEGQLTQLPVLGTVLGPGAGCPLGSGWATADEVMPAASATATAVATAGMHAFLTCLRNSPPGELDGFSVPPVRRDAGTTAAARRFIELEVMLGELVHRRGARNSQLSQKAPPWRMPRGGGR